MTLPPGPRTPAALNTARFAYRPLDTLFAWRRRYGDVFTVPLLVFGTGVYVADPKAIRGLFTGDQSDLHAGEANAPFSAALGDHSVLVLDGPEHMRQRKLLLPPFNGAIGARDATDDPRGDRGRGRAVADRRRRSRCATGCGR